MTTPIISPGIWPPSGYAEIPGRGFAMKRTHVTNGEWGEFVRGLGADRVVLMRHNNKTGETSILGRGREPRDLLKDPWSENDLVTSRSEIFAKLQRWPNYLDGGDIMYCGSLILMKLLENHSSRRDREDLIFSGERQPVIGITWFHGKAYCLLLSDEWCRYDLPTDEQYEYVASNGGKYKYGTKTGELYDAEGRKLAHFGIKEGNEARPVSVDDERYPPGPFGVQLCGNVERWSNFNPKEKHHYGLRGASWHCGAKGLLATARDHDYPDNDDSTFGFMPVVVRQGSSQVAKRRFFEIVGKYGHRVPRSHNPIDDLIKMVELDQRGRELALRTAGQAESADEALRNRIKDRLSEGLVAFRDVSKAMADLLERVSLHFEKLEVASALEMHFVEAHKETKNIFQTSLREAGLPPPNFVTEKDPELDKMIRFASEWLELFESKDWNGLLDWCVRILMLNSHLDDSFSDTVVHFAANLLVVMGSLSRASNVYERAADRLRPFEDPHTYAEYETLARYLSALCLAMVCDDRDADAFKKVRERVEQCLRCLEYQQHFLPEDFVRYDGRLGALAALLEERGLVTDAEALRRYVENVIIPFYVETFVGKSDPGEERKLVDTLIAEKEDAGRLADRFREGERDRIAAEQLLKGLQTTLHYSRDEILDALRLREGTHYIVLRAYLGDDVLSLLMKSLSDSVE